MKPAQIPLNEAKRLKNLETYSILDTLPDADCDAITRIAAGICNMPISLVSIIDKNRQWFKSNHGLKAKETPRDFSFCAHSILNPNKLFIINDATKDKRFFDNPLTINDPNVVFYAGAPLNSSEGYPLGTLCVIDNKPNVLSKNQKESLKLLAKQVVNLFELRKRNRELSNANEEILRLNEQLTEFSYRLSHDIKTPISGIKYLSEILQEDYAGLLDDKGKNWLNLISSRSAYLYSLVEGMLNFTKVINTEIVFEVFNFEELLERVKWSFNWDKTYEISYSNCDINMMQSRIAFIQIFQNLLSNSIKFIDESKPIISISVEVKSKFYNITYTDNSAGIDEKYHRKVFELFETLNEKKGTGIGLPSISFILKRLGGSIDLKKTKNGEIGVIFLIKIPIKKG